MQKHKLNYIFYLLFSFCFASLPTKSLVSQNQSYTLEQVIDIAIEHSPEAQVIFHKHKAAFWQYQSYKASRLPHLSLSSQLLDFERAFVPITLDNGNDAFVEKNSNVSSLSLNLTQNITPTGGQIFLGSSLQRIDLFQDSVLTSYATSPLTVGLVQPLFGFNSFKWLKKTEPLRYLKANKNLIRDLEAFKQKVTTLFFQLVIAHNELKRAQKNLHQSDTLWQISKSRFELGTLGNNDLMQMELAHLEAQNQLYEAQIVFQDKSDRLKSYLAIQGGQVTIVPQIPEKIPLLDIPPSVALDLARENNPAYDGWQIQQFESDMALEKAKKQKAPQISMFVLFGIAQSAPAFAESFQNGKTHQNLQVGIEMPLLDWGVREGKYQIARSENQLTNQEINVEKQEFEQNLKLTVRQFNSLKIQVKIAERSDSLSQNRYRLMVKRFLQGAANPTDLGIARQERDQARQKFLLKLKTFWETYFYIRQLTLFDFETQQKLTQPAE